jgi:predicted peptidase
MGDNPQSSTTDQGAASPKKRILFSLAAFAILTVAIAVAWMLSFERGGHIFSDRNNKVVFDGMTFDDLAALEKIVNAKVKKRQLKQMTKEEREAFEKTRKEAEIAWGKYREHYLQQMKEANVGRAKQGKELYQDFVIPRGTATYMEYDVKSEDLKAGVYDGIQGFKMAYRYFVPEIEEGEKAPLILFLHGSEWARAKYNRYGIDNRYQFKDPEILAVVQPEFQARYPCFFVAPQQWETGAWSSPPRYKPSYALHNAVSIVNALVREYPEIDTNRLYVACVSVGDCGAFEAAAKYPNKFAAIVAPSGVKDPYAFEEKQKTTAWISYYQEGEYPDVIERSNELFELFSSWGGDSRLVVYPGKGRSSWEKVYFDKNLYEWLFQQSL